MLNIGHNSCTLYLFFQFSYSIFLSYNILNSNLTQTNQSLLFTNAASIDGSSFSYDLLNVTPSLNNTRFQKNAYFSKPVDDSAWKQENIPTSMKGKLWIGYRIVMKRNSIHILVEIHELYPVSGRI